MLQADYRGASGTKRSRTDGPQGPGDWTCPKCGNVNFSFRTTCNMRKCGTSKPAEHPPRGIGGHIMQSGYEQALGPMYVGGPGAPPAMPLALTSNYGTPMPIAPSSAVPYDYGSTLSAAYNPISMQSSYGPPGAGGYGAPPVIDGYGLGMGRGHPMSGSRPGVYAENGRKRRGGPDGASDGDWICPKCGNTNFAFRTTCNMRKCNTPKPSEPASRHGNGQTRGASRPPPDGSWTCKSCGNVNYPFRTKCNRRNCGADKPAAGDAPKD
ncbi:hypothetical protein O6H91_16G028700 [Diphasiastrum complanatum]|uniref:Uncharacterized protein n=1 Tax=Diphasiastrum complanatum TaxID=34168 RepID=A0ACC2BB43_DIPCM|nr:hypothetical protein O6H91_16G028700 [Diphasiastrum complanatum]